MKGRNSVSLLAEQKAVQYGKNSASLWGKLWASLPASRVKDSGLRILNSLAVTQTLQYITSTWIAPCCFHEIWGQGEPVQT